MCPEPKVYRFSFNPLVRGSLSLYIYIILCPQLIKHLSSLLALVLQLMIGFWIIFRWRILWYDLLTLFLYMN